MGIFDFVKDAGSKLFGGDDKKAPPQRDLDDVMADKKKGEAISRVIGGMGFKVENLLVSHRDGRVTLKGATATQAEREKIVLLAGNTQGVAQVDDQLTVRTATAGSAGPKGGSATLYTVKSGDSLSKIAKAHYGDAMKYPVIFEANKPMLTDPNKIYPGQVLRIPPVDG